MKSHMITEVSIYPVGATNVWRIGFPFTCYHYILYILYYLSLYISLSISSIWIFAFFKMSRVKMFSLLYISPAPQSCRQSAGKLFIKQDQYSIIPTLDINILREVWITDILWMNQTLQTFVCLLMSSGSLNFLPLSFSVDNIIKRAANTIPLDMRAACRSSSTEAAACQP